MNYFTMKRTLGNQVMLLVLCGGIFCFLLTKSAHANEGFKDCDDCPEMIEIPSGKFTMGTPADELKRAENEGPQKEIVFERSFAMSKYEITVADFSAFVETSGYQVEGKCYIISGEDWRESSEHNWQNPGFSQDNAHPVTCVSWHDANAYTNWLSQQTGLNYALPSEAQWEYAARANTQTTFYTGVTIDATQANFNGAKTYGEGKEGEYRQKSTQVGRFPANPFGLYDILGNMFEWTADCWYEDLSKIPTDGGILVISPCDKRTWKGGSWYNDPQHVRPGFREGGDPSVRANDIGFRVVRNFSVQ
ncbi:formylglycine-generating enzyme family protein [Aliiglaciecola sp. CAU 1673]|uniref:formylglycine-generating enzyme family protein n=1 Tax=Aliiglaciecola sp. CAU 1673 TaxID=3032595 RepID=UPI0023DC15DC|nr:formylglycine-generating enzyme family protein [Aliiglaciecola sp. CAU 1673]MDF2180410.1 formylglycine-generating enzyme family protein [Aliiglaciecola sp. CAU 1673]